ncbi:MAG TPA: hypothetical protein VK963_00070, partial [Candidatus Saccharimonadales bacterium]|nr:hypothetical protein [Candidatus Saccharimonadales bacterium]
MTASSGATTFTTSASITINQGDYVIPTTSTGEARVVTVGGTGTSFTVTPAFVVAVTGETFTIHRPTARFNNNGGGNTVVVQGSTGNVGIGLLAPNNKLTVSGSFTPTSGSALNATLIAPTLTGTVDGRTLAVNGIINPTAALTGTTVNLLSLPQVTGSFNANSVVGTFSRVDVNPAYTGTITNAIGLNAANSSLNGCVGCAITSQVGLRVDALTTGANNAGILIGEATGTNQSNLIIGQSSIPSGSYSIYNSSPDQNYFAGNLGIGTASPTSAKLVVQGATSDNTAAALNVVNSGGSSSLFYVRNDGKVGIGTTAPSANLSISGSGNVSLSVTSSSTTGTAILLANTSTGAHSFEFYTTGTDNTPGYFAINDNTNDTIPLGIEGSTGNFRLRGTAQLGFSSNSAYAVLGNLDVGLGRSAAGTIKVTDGSTGFGTLIAGNVGIGTASPGALLAVGASSQFQVSSSGAVTQRTSTDSATALQVQNNAGLNLFNISTTTGNVSTNQGSLTINGVANPAAPALTGSSSGGSLASGTYFYRLAATNLAGSITSAIASSPASITLTGSPSNNQTTLTWTAVTGSAGYKVYRSTDNGVTWYVNTVSSGATSINDNGTNFSWTTAATPPVG